MTDRKNQLAKVEPVEVELVESLPPEASLPTGLPTTEAELNRYVQLKVAQAFAHREDAIWQPYYQSRRVAQEWKKLQSVREQQKWPIYYEQWGCDSCGTMDRPHAALGKCHPCYLRTLQRLDAITSERRPYVVLTDLGRVERDQRIIERRRAGATWKQIGEELGLSRMAVGEAAKMVQQSLRKRRVK